MRKSRAVKLAAVSALAASFTAGCGSKTKNQTAYCVGPDSRVVQNNYCDDERRPGYFFYAYGARLLGNPAVGTPLSGGQLVDASDKATNAQRGGFGSSASGSSIGRTYKSSGS